MGSLKGVVVHETANPSSTIYNEIAYMKAHYNDAFVHSFVDADHIINIANTNYLSWGVGYPGNGKFVQFEQIEVHSKKAFAREMANAAWYTAYLLNKYKLTPNDACYDYKGTVWSHKAVALHFGGSTHTDPYGYYLKTGKTYFGQGYTMAEFYQLVKSYYTSLQHLSVKYTNTRLTMDVKTVPGHDFYNHVPKSNYTTKRVNYGKTYAGKTVQIDNIAYRDGTKVPYYRCAYQGSRIGWIYGGALGVRVTYKTINSKMTVKKVPGHDFLNHVTASKYTVKRLNYGKTYAGKVVKIDNIAYRDDVKTPYYRCYYGGKKIGWIYGSALS